MSELWGIPSGMLAAQEAQQSADTHHVQMLEAPMKLEQENINLQTSKLALETQQRMLRGMASLGANGQPTASSSADGIAGYMDQMAMIALQSGRPEESKQYAQSASTIRLNQSKIAENQRKQTNQMYRDVSDMLGGVKDSNSWQNAVTMFQMMHPEEARNPNISKILSLPYSPKVIESIRNSVTSLKDRAETEAAEARAADSRAATQEHTARLPLIAAQERSANARAYKLEKEGAITKAPTAGEIKEISDLVQQKYNLDMPDELARARTVSRTAAERMKDLLRQNPAMSRSAAARQAFSEADRRGDFGGLSAVNKVPGASAARPLSMPVKAGALDPKALKPNQYYQGIGQYAGKTYLWTGSAFVPAGKGEGEVSESEESDDDDDSNPDDSAPAGEE